ncbi:sugar phosphate isomerase/epimerase [Paenibacillus sp. YN15]|uniref:sugar phosphate isomerase/epimerase family protein n=1 Tax=Paenibacillus sp. YN15 TaxID=1742774 RepID=UPI000DCDDA3E|nr:sugar phosphate isomerase/epimerase [Paenibacillus sp. YN15]RAU91599.1 sugar phosphate isomerase/epimerase [Paenibacillus sp. YN15]
MAKPKVGLQLYTLRSLTKDDFLGTIRQVAEIGYEAVEFAGFFGFSAKEVKAVLNECGLEAPSAHIGINFTDLALMEEELKQHIEYAQELGLQHIVTPWSPFSEVPTAEELDERIRFLTRAAELVKDAGMQYGYHNHAFEFKLVNGETIIDQMLARIPAELMTMEFDLGWVHKGGKSPAEYIKKYAGRVPLAHIKDFGDGRDDTEVGNGVVDFKSVFPLAEEAGIQYYIVEQEQFVGSPLDSARTSLQYFRNNGIL